MGGGGSKAKSAVSIENNTMIVNESNISILNKNIVDTTVNTIIKRANEATAKIISTQVVDMSGGFVYGDFSPGAVQQDMKGNLNFQTLQKDAVRTDIIMDVMNQLQDTINRNVSTDILDKMNANAAASQSSGFLSTGSGSSDSDTKIINNYSSKNISNKSLNQEIITKLVNNFTQETVNKCIASVENSQYVNYSNKIVYGNFTPGFIKQTIATDLLTNCMQTSETANNITKQIASTTGVSIVDDSSTSKSSDLTATAAASQQNTGPIQDLGNALSGIIAAVPNAIFGGGLGSLFKFPSIPGFNIPGMPTTSNPSVLSSQSSISSFFCIICMVVINVMMGLVSSSSSSMSESMKYRRLRY